MAKKVFTYNLSEPLGQAPIVKVNIDNGDGNLMIDRLAPDEPVTASGELEYLENQDMPTHSLKTIGNQTDLTLRAGCGKGQTWFRLPWAACNGATTWQVHLTPARSIDLTAHSNGGNVKIDLSGMSVTNLKADTGGGNMEVILPDQPDSMSVIAKSGAGNVIVWVPGGIAARIHVTTGLGKVIMDPRFSKIDQNTYQSPDYDLAGHQVEITATSGAGNVTIAERAVEYEAARMQI